MMVKDFSSLLSYRLIAIMLAVLIMLSVAAAPLSAYVQAVSDSDIAVSGSDDRSEVISDSSAAQAIILSSADIVSSADTLSISNSDASNSDIRSSDKEENLSFGEPKAIITVGDFNYDIYESGIGIYYEATDDLYVDWGETAPVVFIDMDDMDATEPLDKTFGVLERNSYYPRNAGTIKVYCNGTITRLNIGSWLMTSLDVTGCSKLESFCAAESPMLSSLRIGSQPDLKELILYEDRSLEEIDLSGFPNLECLDINFLNLSELDLSNNKKLKTIWAARFGYYSDEPKTNPIDIDLRGMTQLADLSIAGSRINDILLDDSYPLLQCMDCSTNRLAFSELGILRASAEAFGEEAYCIEYEPQSTHYIQNTVAANTAFDFSEEYTVMGEVTEFTWYNESGEIITPESADGGKFVFGDAFVGQKLYCVMTNAAFPNMEITTTKVEVTEAEVEEEKPEQGEEEEEENKFTVSGDLKDELIEVTCTDQFKVEDEEDNLLGFNDLCLVINPVENGKHKPIFDSVCKHDPNFDSQKEQYTMWDISLVDKKLTKVKIIEGSLKITIKLPPEIQGNADKYIFTLYHYREDGEAEIISIEKIQGRSITFSADSFSPYILTWSEKTVAEEGGSDDAGSVDTGDNSGYMYMICLNVMLLSGCGIFVSCRRRKESKSN